MLLPALGLPMIVSVTSRSVRSFAIASSRYDSPFRATSAEAVVISRPGTRATSGRGRNRSGSTPTGTNRMRSRATPMSVWMSRIEFSLTTTMRGIRAATRPCIFTNEYHRPTDQRLRQLGACCISSSRSLVIGWCRVTTVGIWRSRARIP